MMQTACPACATVFRITPEQLKTRHGQVRCGKCEQVFDALLTLVDAPSAATALGITLDLPKSPHDETRDADAVSSETGIPSTLAPSATDPTEPTHAATPQGELTNADATSSSDAPNVTNATNATNAPNAINAPEKPTPSKLETYFRASLSRPAVWPWIFVAILSLLLLLAQIVIQFRVELAVIEPALKPALLKLCEPLACDIPLPRKAELLSIESTDLHPDPQHKELLILSATLKNRAPFSQVYPSLELSLTNSEGQPQLRKVIAPAEYLPKKQDVMAGFGAHQELEVNIALIPEKTGKPAPTDYRLYLFYP